MKVNTESTERGRVYTTPLCIETDIKSEGVLCISIEQIKGYYKDNGDDFIYEW